MDRLFEDSFVRPRAWGSSVAEDATLALDVTAGPDALVIEAALPGVKPDDVEITVEDGTLLIRGQSAVERSEDEGDHLVREIRRGSFSRAISLPSGLEPDKATAAFEHGILTLRVPKAEQVKPRQIRITTNGHQPAAGEPAASETPQG